MFERVVQRRRGQLAERVGEQVGPRGAVEVEHHSATLCVGTDGSARQPDAAPGHGNPMARARPQNPSRSSSALAAASTAAIASGLPWNFR